MIVVNYVKKVARNQEANETTTTKTTESELESEPHDHDASFVSDGWEFLCNEMHCLHGTPTADRIQGVTHCIQHLH